MKSARKTEKRGGKIEYELLLVTCLIFCVSSLFCLSFDTNEQMDKNWDARQRRPKLPKTSTRESLETCRIRWDSDHNRGDL